MTTSVFIRATLKAKLGLHLTVAVLASALMASGCSRALSADDSLSKIRNSTDCEWLFETYVQSGVELDARLESMDDEWDELRSLNVRDTHLAAGERLEQLACSIGDPIPPTSSTTTREVPTSTTMRSTSTTSRSSTSTSSLSPSPQTTAPTRSSRTSTLLLNPDFNSLVRDWCSLRAEYGQAIPISDWKELLLGLSLTDIRIDDFGSVIREVCPS